MYALKYKNKFDFLCVSNTPSDFEKKLNNAFLKWKGIQAYGNKATINDFLAQFEKVMVTVEPYNGVFSEPIRWGECLWPLKVEEIYQHFKVRLISEIAAESPELLERAKLVDVAPNGPPQTTC